MTVTVVFSESPRKKKPARLDCYVMLINYWRQHTDKIGEALFQPPNLYGRSINLPQPSGHIVFAGGQWLSRPPLLQNKPGNGEHGPESGAPRYQNRQAPIIIGGTCVGVNPIQYSYSDGNKRNRSHARNV